MPDSQADPLVIRYHVRAQDREPITLAVALDRRSLQLVATPPDNPPPWTALSHNKCPNCPLRSEDSPQCPAAVSIAPIVEWFARTVSHEVLDVRIEVDERVYEKRTKAQEVASSLMGICMAASGCPVLAKLRPMARFHLPFATVEETLYRVLSMYLLAQYLASRKGRKPDWDLNGLVELYREIGIVNDHFFLRLQSAAVEDASLNALVRLHAFSSEIPFSVEQQILDDLEPVFSAYLSNPPQT